MDIIKKRFLIDVDTFESIVRNVVFFKVFLLYYYTDA